MIAPSFLVINAGSSSVKFAAYDADTLQPRLRGMIDDLHGQPRLVVHEGADAAAFGDLPGTGAPEAIFPWLLERLGRLFPPDAIRGVGHRVVHGGVRHSRPVIITPDIVADLDSLSALAPNHQPYNLAPIRAIMAQWPDTPQFACFDTAFHTTQPRLATLFALPRALTEAGIIRYGFHGLSYEYIAQELPRCLVADQRRRVIVAHLGAGASMCAMRDGESIATTMGFTALDGLVMGTRCGALDPGVVLHLINEKGMTAAEVDALLHRRSGMLGVSGLSGDMRTLLAAGTPEAEEALDLFAYRAAREIGSLTAALGGLDALVFTAGIGENAPEMRRRICARSAWAGVALDAARNQRGGPDISAAGARVKTLVLATHEELVIARAGQALLN